MKKVKLRSIEELKKLGFEVFLHGELQSIPDNHIAIISSDDYIVYIYIDDIDRNNNLVIAPRNSITEEAYKKFKEAFEELP